MFAPVRTVAPTLTPVTLAEAKAHLRAEYGEEDALITGLIGAAVSYLDGWSGMLGRALVTQTWRQDFAGFSDKMRLPMFPVASVSEVTYVDAAGASQTLAGTEWQLLADERGAYVCLRTGRNWPATGEGAVLVSITYVCGHSVADVPMAIKQAILLMVGDWHRNRETVAVGATTGSIPLSATVDALLAPYRRGQI